MQDNLLLKYLATLAGCIVDLAINEGGGDRVTLVKARAMAVYDDTTAELRNLGQLDAEGPDQRSAVPFKTQRETFGGELRPQLTETQEHEARRGALPFVVAEPNPLKVPITAEEIRSLQPGRVTERRAPAAGPELHQLERDAYERGKSVGMIEGYAGGERAGVKKGLEEGQILSRFQDRVKPWLIECFGGEVARDTSERNYRFLEEALELVQACSLTEREAHQLVSYVYGRAVGEMHQEVGGVMVTLAALCLAQSLNMHEEGERELRRVQHPAVLVKIRAKQAAKPKGQPLPGHGETR